MLTRLDGIQLVQVHQQIVGQSHLLVILVRKVDVVHVVHPQTLWKHTSQEGRLATSLRTY